MIKKIIRVFYKLLCGIAIIFIALFLGVLYVIDYVEQKILGDYE